MDKPELLRILTDAHAELRSAIGALPDAEFEAEAMPGWTRRDIVAHIEWWENHSADVLRALDAGREPYSRLEPFDPDGLNAQTLADNRDRTASDVKSGEAAAWDRLSRLLAAAAEADLFAAGRFAWLGGDPFVGMLRADTDEHWAEHLPHLIPGAMPVTGEAETRAD